MSNTIDNKEVSNSMELLSFYWVVSLKDGRLIFQFHDGIEEKFDLNWFKSGIIKYFCLYHKEGKCYFLIDLEKGGINFNNHNDYDSDIIKNNIRLIYFRRNSVEIGTNDLKVKNHDIIYHLGYQYTSESGSNKQIILEIKSDGLFVIRS